MSKSVITGWVQLPSRIRGLGHILVQGNLDAGATQLGGYATNLGGFKNFVQGHDDRATVRIGVEKAVIEKADTRLVAPRPEDDDDLGSDACGVWRGGPKVREEDERRRGRRPALLSTQWGQSVSR